MSIKKSNTRKLVVVAMLGAISFILMFFEFPILPMFPFLKVDFSDVPVLISTFVFGPISGILVAFVRSLLNLLIKGAELTRLVGNIAGLLASILYLFPIYAVFRYSMKKWMQILGVTCGTIAMTIFMAIVNYFIIMPLYLKIGGLPPGTSISQMVVAAVIPFNLLKGAIVGTAFIIILNAFLPWMQRNHYLSIEIHK